MQGTWTVSVKSKEPFSSPQQFVISGAATGNGVYVGDTATPPVTVTGDAWSITVQHNPGSGFVDSFDQIVFPVKSGNQYKFDIQANDDDVDPVFDDLILTCSTPVTLTDFVVYGNVSWYSGCIYNPCYPPPYFVIDSAVGLADALARPALRKPIEALYPERVFRQPIPLPDPPPFRPLVLPVEGERPLPAKTVQVFDAPSQAARVEGASQNAASLTSRVVTLAQSSGAVSTSASISASALAGITSRFRLCQTGPLPQYLLRFQEYDRSTAELAGGAYTGTGPRRTLGVTMTDRNGNYVFRFSMSLADYLDEVFNDVAVGETPLSQVMPDVIVQVLDNTVASGVIYETAPYWNIPFLKRINVCVPKGLVQTPAGCIEGQIIQSIGNITVGPLVSGTRTTSNTFLDANGVITSSSSLGPQVTCAAWGGALYFYACLSDPEVRYYTIRFKRAADPDSTFQFVIEGFAPYHVAPAPVYLVQQSVGPTTRTLEVDGAFQLAPSYLDTETDPAGGWLDRWKLVKMVLSSSYYQTVLGGAQPITFRIEGYRLDGSKVGGADDRITLFIDNNAPDQFISPTISMITNGGPVTQGNCALFTLPPDQLNAPLEIMFRSNQYEGYMDTYQLYMDKGAIGNFPIISVGPPPAPTPLIVNSYRNGMITDCSFRGTIDDPHYGSPNANVLTADVGPASGNWLTDTEVFCAFSVNLSASVRITDGQSVFGPYYSGPILIGIKK
jgi:hypothetical protein